MSASWIRRAYKEIPFIILLITAAIAGWVSYNPSYAMQRLLILCGAVGIYYAMSIWLRDVRKISLWIGAGGVVLSVIFLLFHDWSQDKESISLIRSVGILWMSIRPALGKFVFDKNIIGWLFVATIPYSFTCIYCAFTEKHFLQCAVMAFACGLEIFALILSSERSAWLASACLVFMMVCWVVSKPIQQRLRVNRGVIFIVVLLLFGLVGAAILLSFFGNAFGAQNAVLSLSYVSDRYNDYLNSLLLILDYPFTGVGLGSFSALYSQYVLLIPNMYLNQSHNLYINLIVEQGIIGGGCFIFIVLRMLGKVIFIKPSEKRLKIIHWAVLGSLLLSAIVWLAEDPLYSGAGYLLLFIFLAVGNIFVRTVESEQIARPVGVKIVAIIKNKKVLIGIPILCVLLIIVFIRPITAAFYSNYGAILMEKAQLKNWSMEDPVVEKISTDAMSIYDPFIKAISLDPQNFTANYRLGLINLNNLQFERAIAYLETVQPLYSEHRGIQKARGLSYAWDGQIEKAVVYLSKIPEAYDEMTVYSFWWSQQERPDLSEIAMKIADRLSNR